MKSNLLLFGIAMLFLNSIACQPASAQTTKSASQVKNQVKFQKEDLSRFSKKHTKSPFKEILRPINIGDFFQGGIVFYVDETGKNGLVCAISDQSEIPGSMWSAGNSVTGANRHEVYLGKANTVRITQSYGEPSLSAAALCSKLVSTEEGVTYDDWYLPSKEELILLLNNYSIIDSTAKANGGHAFSTHSYWSSTEENAKAAWRVNSNNEYDTNVHDNISTGLKSIRHNVRAIRKFVRK